MWFSKAMQGFSVRNVWQAAATVFDKSLEARLGSPVTTRSLSPNNSTLASRIDRLLSHKLTANGNNGQTGFLGIFRNTKPKCKSGSDSFLVDAAKIFSGRKNALGRWHISTKTESNIVTRSQAEVELHVLLESRYATLTKSHEYSPHAISIEEVNQFNPDAPAPQQIRTTVTPTGTPTPAAAPANDANGNATQPAAPALVVAPPTALVQEMPWHPPLVIRTASPEQVADVAAAAALENAPAAQPKTAPTPTATAQPNPTQVTTLGEFYGCTVQSVQTPNGLQVHFNDANGPNGIFSKLWMGPKETEFMVDHAVFKSAEHCFQVRRYGEQRPDFEGSDEMSRRQNRREGLIGDINQAATPLEAKAIADRNNRVFGFEIGGDDWRGTGQIVEMYKAQLHKFARNPQMRAALLATGDAHLINTVAEMKGSDNVLWGSVQPPKAGGKMEEQGLNMLGRILMQVRTDLRNQDPAQAAPTANNLEPADLPLNNQALQGFLNDGQRYQQWYEHRAIK